MRILYVGMKYDYGRAERGYSFEHYNFYESLRNIADEIIYFDFMSLLQEVGKRNMNARLLEMVRSEKPDLMFTILFKDELYQNAVHEISTKTGTTTVNWFCDDHWRFDNYSRFWAPHFSWVITTAKSAVPKYDRHGLQNVIKSQWACNHLVYRKLDLPLKYDVTFVGQPHGNRRQIVDALREKNIDVHCFGLGWEEGRVSQEEMIRIFNQSRINLNFSNASVMTGHEQTGAIAAGLDWIARSLEHAPFGNAMKKAGRRVLNIGSEKRPAQVAEMPAGYADQIKGRNFEVPGCGGFLLTSKTDDLESYYEHEKEVVCYDGIPDLVDKINYYLAHESERAAIAERGYKRTLRDHTYQRRFEEIFAKIGLANG